MISEERETPAAAMAAREIRLPSITRKARIHDKRQ